MSRRFNKFRSVFHGVDFSGKGLAKQKGGFEPASARFPDFSAKANHRAGGLPW